MKNMKSLIVFFILVCLSGCVEGNNALHGSLIGEWECQPFTINNEMFRASGKGQVTFYSNKSIITKLFYVFDFEGGYKLNLQMDLIGVWKGLESGFMDYISKVNIKKIEGNVPLSEEKLRELINATFVLEKETNNKINFASRKSFVWTSETSSDEINCTKLG